MKKRLMNCSLLLRATCLTFATNALAKDVACWPDEPQKYAVVGIAKSSAGELLYCEWHTEQDGRRRVTYVSPAREHFAKKEIFWDAAKTRPQVIQTDFRHGEFLEVRQDGAWVLRYQKNSDSALQQKAIPAASVDIVDAGFDQAVRDRWELLRAGEKSRLNFASPALQRVVPLRVTARNSFECRTSQPEWSCFWVEADSALARLIVDPLRLTYDEQQRLRFFEGVVNIRDDHGKKLVATIEYRYPSASTGIRSDGR